MRPFILAVMACGLFPCAASADRSEALKLWAEMRAERTWARDELWKIELVKKDETAFRAELAKLEEATETMERILPHSPRWEEWVPQMEKAARDCGAGLVAYEPSMIEHDRYGEVRFPVEIEGDESTVNCFRTRLRNRTRTSAWSDTGKSDDGKALADVSIFYAPPNEASLRPCKDFAASAVKDLGRHLAELERVIFQAAFAELQEICRKIEAAPQERRLAGRREDLRTRLALIAELLNRHEPLPDPFAMPDDSPISGLVAPPPRFRDRNRVPIQESRGAEAQY
ncbi:MAG TPA: hypothetical protein VMS98_02630 [Thermoanaerobaculia bacterium]|nr:hypothetical protein [Thermoanaerobaculia bacterium]